MAGEVDNVPLGTVLAEEHHPVSRLDTGLRQAAGRLPSFRGELRSGERDPAPPRAGTHQRSILWSSTYHMFEEIAQRLHRYPPATCVIRRARHPLLGMASRISRRGGMGPSPVPTRLAPAVSLQHLAIGLVRGSAHPVQVGDKRDRAGWVRMTERIPTTPTDCAARGTGARREATGCNNRTGRDPPAGCRGGGSCRLAPRGR